MTDNIQQIYIDKVLQLVGTIRIKSEATAAGLNKELTDYHGADTVDTLDPTTWRYYRNLAGEYHDFDEPMYITSMDTLENILFSKENLTIHRATYRAYQYGTRQYRELTTRYPNQTALILGILYPVDIDAAIAAQDGEILGWPEELVEENEYSFIYKLQDWIYGYKSRWHNAAFNLSDELYETVNYGMMALFMIPAIMNIRLAACKTNEVHSYHLMQFLSSHGVTDVELLTKEQMLWLYRNMPYIERNSGQRDTFDWVVDNILTKRKIPLAKFTMQHDVSAQPEELYSTPMFRRTPLNLGYNVAGQDVITVDDIFDKEAELARDNVLMRDDLQAEAQVKLENSPSNVLATKALESAMVDYSDSTPYRMEDILLNHWLDWSMRGLYTAFVGVTNPRTGERIPLSAKEAYIFMTYAFCSSIGIDLTYVPQVLASRVQRVPLVNEDEILSVVDRALVDRSIATQALSLQEPVPLMISTEAFYSQCRVIYRCMDMQRRLVAYQEHHVRRGMVQNMVHRIYSDNVWDLAEPNTTYASWFAERNIRITDFTQEQLGLLYVELTREATGLALNTTESMKDLQAAMTRLTKQLVSYSVHLMTEINDSAIRDMNWSVVRLGDIDAKGFAHQYVSDLTVEIERFFAHAMATIYMDVNCGIRQLISASGSAKYRQEINVKLCACKSQPTWYAKLDIAGVTLHAAREFSQNNRKVIPGFGIDEYLALSAEQAQAIPDIYGCYTPSAPGETALAERIRIPMLSGLIYIPPTL